MRTFSFTVILLFSITLSFSQKIAQDFGYRHLKLGYENDTIHILVKSKAGEENVKKPIIFEVQGSHATPLIVHDGSRQTRYVSLVEGYVEENFHLVLVNKPGIPLICHKDSLDKGKYRNLKTKAYPKIYRKNNNLNYYVKRNNLVMNFLTAQKWVDKTRIIAVGHSEGSTIVAHMADKMDDITHLIYSGGTPYYSRILAMIQQDRKIELKEKNNWTKQSFDYWKDIIKYPFALDRNKGWNSNYGTYSFSQNENDVLKRLKIPILISYGTLDEGSPFNDMLHIEIIKERKTNFLFNAYVGLDHYYQQTNLNNSIKHSKEDHLSKVVKDWLQWIDDN